MSSSNNQVLELDPVDLSLYLDVCSFGIGTRSYEFTRDCTHISGNLKEFGVAVVRDPRLKASDYDCFLDTMECYFKTLPDNPHLQHEVGVTPERTEVPRSSLYEEHRPLTRVGPDPKWRYFWKIGPRPENTTFKELTADPFIPAGFPEWKETMDSWGNKMLDTIITVAEMAAFGFGLPRDGFTSQMHLGPHILASTGSDLNKYNQEGTVIEAYHHDLNLLTIHGSNRFPGLNIWLRNAARVEVKVPVGCFLIQAGKQFEWLTGGDCLTCKHEVVVTKNTINAINKAKELDRSLWRISATLYAHLASDAIMKPLDAFLMTIRAHNYLPVTAGDYVEEYAETNPNPSPNPN